LNGNRPRDGLVQIDPDTAMIQYTLQAALRAAEPRCSEPI